jgi:plasmid stabilization system protein ParE
VTRRIRTEPEASAELAEAALWYEGHRPGLGAEFLGAVDATTEFIARFPEAGVRVPNIPKDLPVRRAAVRRVPFHVVYVDFPEVVRVLAVAHDRRSPGYWRTRTWE